jgi:hypothetical protein
MYGYAKLCSFYVYVCIHKYIYIHIHTYIHFVSVGSCVLLVCMCAHVCTITCVCAHREICNTDVIYNIVTPSFLPFLVLHVVAYE